MTENEMVERVAQALVEAWPSWGTWDCETTQNGARAAIKAMRVPTAKMLERGSHGTNADSWANMIDAALK